MPLVGDRIEGKQCVYYEHTAPVVRVYDECPDLCSYYENRGPEKGEHVAMEENETPEGRALIPLQTQEVTFYEDTLLLVLVERDGQRLVGVPIRQFCTHLGVDWSGQLQRMKRDEVLVAEMMSVVMTPTLIAGQDQPIRGQRRSQPATCLPLDIFPGWLFTVDPKRVKAEHQEKIQRYRRNCYRTLAEAFRRGELFAGDELLPPPATVVAASDPLALVAEQHQEVMAGQARIEASLTHAVTLLTDFMSTQQARLDKIDERTQRLTPAHALQVSNAVDRLCQLWRKKSPHLTDDKAHSWAYHRIHQRFSVSSYKEIADERFEEALAYVRQAIQRASDGTEPEQGGLFES